MKRHAQLMSDSSNFMKRGKQMKRLSMVLAAVLWRVL
jgi:hypothetical protein